MRADPRVDLPDRPALLDAPSAHSFSIGDEEFIGGTPEDVAEQIVGQCTQVGAGNFAAQFDRSQTPRQLQAWYRDFGARVIPLLHATGVAAPS
jgi:hypothetical protein